MKPKLALNYCFALALLAGIAGCNEASLFSSGDSPADDQQEAADGGQLIDATNTAADADVLICDEGEAEVSGECVVLDLTAPVTSATPTALFARAMPPVVQLTTDEPAIIYYTIDDTAPTTSSPSAADSVDITDALDGVPVRFFAVDSAGNTELEQSVTFTVDIVPPGPVTGFAAALASQVDLSWTNPVLDLAGVLLVRREGLAVQGSPVDGTLYSTGDELNPGEDVIYVGPSESYPDLVMPAVRSHYAAWAFDLAGNYSSISRDDVLASLGGGDIVIEVTLAGVVTVTTQPEKFTVAATATAGASSMSLDLSIQNDGTRITNNTKLVVDSVNDGIIDTPDGYLDILPFFHFGPEALDSAATAQRPGATILSLTGTDPIVITAHLQHDPMIYVESWGDIQLLDSGTGTGVGSLVDLLNGGESTSATVSEDGRFLYVGAKWNPYIRVFDLTTLAHIITFNLFTDPDFVYTEALGLVGGVAAYNGSLFAVASTTCAGGGRSALSLQAFQLIKIDTENFTVTERVSLASNGAAFRAMELVPGTSIALVADSRQVVHIVDLATMLEIDTDPSVAGVQGIDLTGTYALQERLRSMAIDPSGEFAYLAGGARTSGNVQVTRISLSDYSAQTIPTLSTSDGILDIAVIGPELWILQQSWSVPAEHLRIVDLNTWDEVFVPVTGTWRSLISSADGSKVFAPAQYDATFSIIDTATKTEIAVTTLADWLSGHNIFSSAF